MKVQLIGGPYDGDFVEADNQGRVLRLHGDKDVGALHHYHLRNAPLPCGTVKMYFWEQMNKEKAIREKNRVLKGVRSQKGFWVLPHGEDEMVPAEEFELASMDCL